MAISLEHDLPISRLAEIPDEDFYAVDIGGVNLYDDRRYQLGFYTPDHPRVGSVIIKTETRSDFLEKGTEQEAEAALIGLGKTIRQETGGVFHIHPFYGAVWNTKTNPVATGFCANLQQLDERLHLSIDLSNQGHKFDDASTREALAIGTTVAIPGPNAQRLHNYLTKPNPNPNQKNRDQAVANDLGERWDAEFDRFNPRARGIRRLLGKSSVPKAIEMTPKKVLDILSVLEDQGIFADTRIDTLRLGMSANAEVIAFDKLYYQKD